MKYMNRYFNYLENIKALFFQKGIERVIYPNNFSQINYTIIFVISFIDEF